MNIRSRLRSYTASSKARTYSEAVSRIVRLSCLKSISLAARSWQVHVGPAKFESKVNVWLLIHSALNIPFSSCVEPLASPRNTDIDID